MEKDLNTSKVVTSNQPDIHEDLGLILNRYSHEFYKRPVAEFSKESFKDIIDWVQSFENKDLVLDMGCGTGESSYNLHLEHPECLIIGIDKSVSRIDRKNGFKDNLPASVKIVRGELLDLWYLFYQATREGIIKVKKQYILFPNPWPKKKLIKRRFHANPIWPYILGVSKDIELRTNWMIYAKEFQFASKHFGRAEVKFSEYVPTEAISNFELKYLKSNHSLYKVELF